MNRFYKWYDLLPPWPRFLFFIFTIGMLLPLSLLFFNLGYYKLSFAYLCFGLFFGITRRNYILKNGGKSFTKSVLK